jgi:hypothetical protein
MSLAIVCVTTICATFVLYHICSHLYFSPLAQIPGSNFFALTKLRLAYEDYRGTRTRTIHHLHQKYGPIVRVGPSEVSCNSLEALRQIYGAGSTFGRPRSFYAAFDVYGQPHMFTYYSSAQHSAQKKMMSRMYAKSTILSGPVWSSIQSKAREFLNLIESDPKTASHLEKSLHYYSLDNISWVVFRGCEGVTSVLTGRASDSKILSDIHQCTTRKCSWFQVHLPRYTAWAMSCGFLLRSILDLVGLLPGKKPLAYSGLQDYALATFNEHRGDDSLQLDSGEGLMMRLLKEQEGHGGSNTLSDIEIAAECADHLDAGLKTTSDALKFALWALSLPGHQQYQQRLAAEVSSARGSLFDEAVSPAEQYDRLPLLDAVVKETLRLYSPIPASQPRTSHFDSTIGGYFVPAGTAVSCQAYSLHRNPKVFPDPYKFNPDRWLSAGAEIAVMKRWWWPFSSGGRMCLGMQ